MTTKSRAASAVLTLMVATPLLAQEPEASMAWSEPIAATQGAECEGGPLAVVAQFLSLGPEQVQALAQLLREREEALRPILQEIARREERIRALIASGGQPRDIGRLVIEIHRLRQGAEAAQAQFLARVHSLLDDEQRQRWDHLRAAAQLRPVLPAFQALGLL